MAQLDEVKKELLTKFKEIDVNIFYDYLIKLSIDPKSNWVNLVHDQQLIIAYEKVSKTGLTIDGESVRLEYRAKTNEVYASYDYHAYKNRVLVRYPETIFDIQVVHHGEEFTFSKENGKVHYKHNFGNPFLTNKQIVGAYCIIKNQRGEFIELINQDDIQKFRASAKTTSIWDAWLSEMVKKSVVKRACKTHFKDLVADIEEIDNENYDPNIAGKTRQQQATDKTIQRKLNAINNSKSVQELNSIPDLNTEELQNAYKQKMTLLNGIKG